MFVKLYDEKMVFETSSAQNTSCYSTVLKELDSLVSSNKHRNSEPNQIREALMKGYVEMSTINLSICRESLHLEYEAEYTFERLVTGG